MVKFVLILWILVGIRIVRYSIHKKREYGYISPVTIGTSILIVVSIIIWPITLVNILNFIKREEKIINDVITENPKYTRDMLIKGGKIWCDMRKRK